jgi:hypothetical protein
MGSGISFLTGAVIGANEIAEDNLKQKNKLKEIQWQLSRQAAFDTIKRFQEDYASEQKKVDLTNQSIKKLLAKNLHPVAIDAAIEQGMDPSKPETEDYIRGMKVSPKATQLAQPNQPMQPANPFGMPTTNSPAMQGTPQPPTGPTGTGATGGGTNTPGMPSTLAPQPQQPQMAQPGQPQPAMNGNGGMPQPVAGTIPRGAKKNMPNMQPLQNAYETLGYKGKDLGKVMAPYQGMTNPTANKAYQGSEEFDIQLPPPKSLEDASTKAQTLVMQNLDRINSGTEAMQAWRGMMKSFRVRDEDMGRVAPNFDQVPEGFWQNPEAKRKMAEGAQKALAVELAQQYQQNGQPEKAQQILVKHGVASASDIMGLDPNPNKTGTLTRIRTEGGSKSALDPNPGFNQIKKDLQLYYPGNIVRTASGDIEIKNVGDPKLRDEIAAVQSRAQKLYQTSMREEGGRISGMTPGEAIEQAYEEVVMERHGEPALTKYLDAVKTFTAAGKGEDAEALALSMLSVSEQRLVRKRLMKGK